MDVYKLWIRQVSNIHSHTYTHRYRCTQMYAYSLLVIYTYTHVVDSSKTNFCTRKKKLHFIAISDKIIRFQEKKDFFFIRSLFSPVVFLCVCVCDSVNLFGYLQIFFFLSSVYFFYFFNHFFVGWTKTDVCLATCLGFFIFTFVILTIVVAVVI